MFRRLKAVAVFSLCFFGITAYACCNQDSVDAVSKYLSVSPPLKSLSTTSSYGYRIHPITGKRSFHSGLDFKSPEGAPAFSVMKGKVVKIGYDRRSGNFLIIRYGTFTVSYCHLSKIMVTKGQYVQPGEIVALTGSTGRSTGPHLHLTTKVNGKPFDPKVLIDFIIKTREEAIKYLNENQLADKL